MKRFRCPGANHRDGRPAGELAQSLQRHGERRAAPKLAGQPIQPRAEGGSRMVTGALLQTSLERLAEIEGTHQLREQISAEGESRGRGSPEA